MPVASQGTSRTTAGIELLSGGSVTNLSGGSISGFYGIVGLLGALTVVNAGSISGSHGQFPGFGTYYGDGIQLRRGGSVVNQSGGVIGGHDGIYGGKYGAVSVVNAGSIAGVVGDGVVLAAGGSVTNQ